MDLYREKIIDHFKNPRNKGVIRNPDLHTHESNTSCGDTIDIFLKLNKNKISDIKFQGEGCAISQASISMLTEKLKGESLKNAKKISEKDLLNILGIDISPGRIGCALLPKRALDKLWQKKTP